MSKLKGILEVSDRNVLTRYPNVKRRDVYNRAWTTYRDYMASNPSKRAVLDAAYIIDVGPIVKILLENHDHRLQPWSNDEGNNMTYELMSLLVESYSHDSELYLANIRRAIEDHTYFSTILSPGKMGESMVFAMARIHALLAQTLTGIQCAGLDIISHDETSIVVNVII